MLSRQRSLLPPWRSLPFRLLSVQMLALQSPVTITQPSSPLRSGTLRMLCPLNPVIECLEECERTVWFVEGTACGLAFNSALVVRSVELLFVGNIFLSFWG